jgi:phospholipase C
MLAVGLEIHIDNGRARISFDKGFTALTGIDDLIFSVSDRIKDINLIEYSVEIVEGERGVPAIRAGIDLEERGSEIGAPGPDLNIEDMSIWLTILMLHGYPKGPDFFETAMRRDNGGIIHSQLGLASFLDTHPRIVGLWASFLDVILGVGGVIGLSPSSIDELIQDAIDKAEQKLAGGIGAVGKYFYDTIMHLVQRDHVMHELSADDESLIVFHHAKPSPSDLLDVLAQSTADAGALVQTLTVLDESTVQPELPPSEDLLPEALYEGMGDRIILEQVESSSEDADDESALSNQIAKSSESPSFGDNPIKHIVVLMLENRSFDHMFGYRGLGSSDVMGLSGKESNLLDPGAPPYEVYHLTKTSGIRSPGHKNDATLSQIGDGKMDGFVKDYASHTDVRDPSLVMGYYTAQELPMYDFLANNFAICDRWYSSHPGATQCNRFCAITGSSPELENFDVTDPRLAYYEATTVFDVLTDLGIDWAYAEGNIAFLRMFDRYRIDTEHIIPFRDDFSLGLEDTFERRVTEGRLPAVTYVDPRYIDIPPSWDANDDLPPADVCHGQVLVRRLYRLLSEAPTWKETLLIITYDEHGGFYDHMPPGVWHSPMRFMFPTE